MLGTTTFDSISSALKAGYQVYDRLDAGFIVRIKTQAGWRHAFVDFK
jgi:hypothetical protein